MSIPVYLTGADVARMLGIQKSSVATAVAGGRIPVAARLQSGTPLFDPLVIERIRLAREGTRETASDLTPDSRETGAHH